MMEGSPQRFLHDPIVEYLTKRGVTINTNTRIADLLYDTDKDGAPTKINGFVLSGTHPPPSSPFPFPCPCPTPSFHTP